jgi:uroporphyrinogen decarboxylase
MVPDIFFWRLPMTPRDRVLAALKHQPTDRVPCDFWAEEPTWNRLLSHVGYNDRDRFLDELDVDIRHLDVPTLPEIQVRPGTFQNMWGERYVYHTTPWGPMREDVRGALSEAKGLGELEAFGWPTPDQLDYSRLPGQCKRWDGHALVYGFADVWQRPALVRGLEEMLVDMALRPDWVHCLCRKFTEFYQEDYTRAAEMTGGRIDLYLLISDLGSQTGPLISLGMFREFVAPYLKQMVDCIHGLEGRVLFHSCGSIRPFIPDLIRLGIDVLDPIQPTGPDMSPERLASEFAGRICFHGGIDMQHLLTRGSPEQVRAEVRRYCTVLGRAGGYVLGPTHLFQPDVPVENIFAVYRPKNVVY